jgi:uncharacterized protein YjbJ (UPF0337 family)
MNSDMAQNRWSEIKDKIETKWGKFSNSEIESLQGNLDGIVGKIQKVYGYARDRAEREYHEFRVSLKTVLAPPRPRPR